MVNNNDPKNNIKDSIIQTSSTESLDKSGVFLREKITKGFINKELTYSQATTAKNFPNSLIKIASHADRFFRGLTVFDILFKNKTESVSQKIFTDSPRLLPGWFGVLGEMWNYYADDSIKYPDKYTTSPTPYWPNYNPSTGKQVLTNKQWNELYSKRKINVPKNFKKKKSSNLTNKLGVANSNPTVLDATPLVIYPKATTTKTKKSFMSYLKETLEIGGEILSAVGSTGGSSNQNLHTENLSGRIAPEYLKYPLPQAHSGGKIPGRSEVVALLQGGETVRTEGQENALQADLEKKNKTAAIDNSSNNEQQKELQKQMLLRKLVYTKDMQNHIINTIAEAFKYNQYGFRKLLRQY